jgi:hypothetical protein
MRIIRHGDVNLHLVMKIPKTAKEVKQNGSYVLAEGEATGSKHVLSVGKVDELRVYRDQEAGTTYIQLGKVGTLTHTHDHETLEVPAGIYIQIPEREIDHFGESVERKVID